MPPRSLHLPLTTPQESARDFLPLFYSIGCTRLGDRVSSRKIIRHDLLASRITPISDAPHDLSLLLLLLSWGTHGHAARLRLSPAASRAGVAHGYTYTVGLKLLLYVPTSEGTSTSLPTATPSPSERSDDGGTAFLSAAVGCGSPPQNSLPTTMLPS